MLSPLFKERMKNILGNEYDSFIRAVENGEPVRGLRVNTLKCNIDSFTSLYKSSLEEIPYCKEGFIPNEPEGLGNTPEHHSGMFYIQDPGAMAPIPALGDVRNDAWVLDMCAAPGGKSSQIAAKIPNGFLLANEFVPKRAKTVVGNFERLGVKNAIVTSLDTSELTRMFSAVFDIVICDAPCSGEGMFRKSDEAIADWSIQNVKMCSERQLEILKNAPSLIKPGGYLLYSTCTYSLEENEMVVDKFLSENPDFSLVSVPRELELATSPGICFEGAQSTELYKARRFYPHKSRGEGQFVALMKKSEKCTDKTSFLYKSSEKPLNKEEMFIVEKFLKDNLDTALNGRISKVGGNIVIIPHDCPIPERAVFMSGVLLGEIIKGTLHPSHQFFSAYGNYMKRKEELKDDADRITRYLRGEEIDSKELTDGGWCVLTYHSVTLGGGKASGGKIKNHYPKGLRLK